MFQVRRRKQVGYEDLLRELEGIERTLLVENSALAMDLMVLEAKIRERFVSLENRRDDSSKDFPLLAADDVTVEDLRLMIPQDLPPFPSWDDVNRNRSRKKRWETIGMAAALATVTALGMFGLATLMQVVIGWLM